jgi:anti-sigma B factor antagonist
MASADAWTGRAEPGPRMPETGSRWQAVMEEQGLIITVGRRPGYVLVTVSGEIDIATAGQLRDRLAGPAGSGQRVIIDFGGVSFIDAAGAGVLADAAARAAARGGSLQLAAAGWQVRRVLALTGLDRSIPLAATVAEARASLRSGPGSQADGTGAAADRA